MTDERRCYTSSGDSGTTSSVLRERFFYLLLILDNNLPISKEKKPTTLAMEILSREQHSYKSYMYCKQCNIEVHIIKKTLGNFREKIPILLYIHFTIYVEVFLLHMISIQFVYTIAVGWGEYFLIILLLFPDYN